MSTILDKYIEDPMGINNLDMSFQMSIFSLIMYCIDYSTTKYLTIFQIFYISFLYMEETNGTTN